LARLGAARRLASTLGALRFSTPTRANEPAWLQLRAELWPHVSRAEHLADQEYWLEVGHFVCIAHVGEMPIGLVEVSSRSDYVNGTSTAPVAFLEGLYVVPAYRRRGVATRLVAQVQIWAQSRGLTELASDSSLDNTVAHAVHRALGFAETERVIYFKKYVSGA